MDLPENLSDAIETDGALGESNLPNDESLELSEINGDVNESVLTLSNEKTGNDILAADVDSEEEPEYDHITRGTYNGGRTNSGYTIYCADEDLETASTTTNLTMADPSVLLNSFYGTSVGELLKIFVYKYYDELSSLRMTLYTANAKTIKLDTDHRRIADLMQYFVWSFTDSPYRNINPEGDSIPGSDHQNIFGLLWNRYTYPEDLIQKAEVNPEIMDSEYYSEIIDNNIDSRKVITDFLIDYVTRVVNDYDAGYRVPDHAIKQTSDTRVKVYDFVGYLSDEKHQNLFGYKTSTQTIVRSMSVEKIALNETVNVGDQTEFLIVVKNTGNINLADVFVKEDKYDGLEYVTYKDPSKKWSYDGADTWKYDGILAPEESINFTVVFKATKAGNFTNYVIAGSNETDNETANNNTTVVEDSIPDIKVEKITVNSEVVVGEEVTFTIKVTNNGTADLSDVKVIEKPPEGFTYQGISGDDWKSEDDNTFAYQGILKAGASSSFDIKYLTSVNGTFTNVVVVTSNSTDNKTSSSNKTKVLAPRLKASKIAVTSEVIAGHEIVYVINVTNVGDCDIADAYVIEDAPESFKYQSMSGDGWKTSDGVNFTYTGVLAPGESTVFEVSYLTSESGSYQNVIYVSNNLTKENETANDTITVLKPGMKVDKVANDESVYVGDETSFTITVTNTGECNLTGVFVEDVVPNGLTYSDYENGTGKWTKQGDKYSLTDSLNVGESATLIIKVLTTESGNFTNCAVAGSDDTENDTSNDTVTVYKPSMVVDKVANDEFVYVGDETSFTITVTNTGDCNLTGVFVEDVIPSGLTYSSYENGTGKWNKDGDKYSLISTLESGESVTLIINVLTTESGNFTNCAVVGSNQTEDNESEDTVTVYAPSMVVDKVANDEFVYVGDETSFTIIVTNTGDCSLTGVFVEDVIPSGLTYSSYENGTGKWTKQGDKYTLNDSLNAGESVTLIINVLTSEAGNFTNCAVVGSDQTGDNESEDAVTVYAPSMVVDKVANDEFVYVGDETSFTITVRNTGDCNLTGVYVEDVIPSGLTYSSYENGTGKWNKEGDKYFLTSTLEAGDSVTLIINVLTSEAGNFTNCAVVGSNQTGDEKSNDTVTVYAPSMVVDKVADDEFVYVGDETSFTITVKNTGDCNLTGVYVGDVIPSGLTYSSYENGTGKWNKEGDKYFLTSTLEAGDSVTLIINVLTSEAGNFTNCAVASSNQTDDETSNDTVTVYKPSMEVDKVANDENVLVGDETSFTITVKNTGDCDLTGVFVEDKVPQGLTYTGYENGTGDWDKDGDKYYLTKALKAGESATLIIDVLATAEGNFTNCVTAGSNQTDNQTANDTVEVNEIPEDNVTETGEETPEIANATESEASIESSDSIVADIGKATGNPLLLLMVVLSLIGVTGFRKNKR